MPFEASHLWLRIPSWREFELQKNFGALCGLILEAAQLTRLVFPAKSKYKSWSLMGFWAFVFFYWRGGVKPPLGRYHWNSSSLCVSRTPWRVPRSFEIAAVRPHYDLGRAWWSPRRYFESHLKDPPIDTAFASGYSPIQFHGQEQHTLYLSRMSREMESALVMPSCCGRYIVAEIGSR